MLLSFMLGVPKALFPFMLGAPAPTLPLLGAPMTLFLLFGKCACGVLRETNEESRPFSKVDEVDVYPYHLGEVALSS